MREERIPARKIRLLYTIPNFDTAGSGKLLVSIAKKLHPDLFDVEICCFHGRGEYFKTVQALGFRVHFFSFTADMSDRWRGLKEVIRISSFFRSLRVDIIHSLHYAPDYSEALAARLAGCKWVYTKKNMSWGGKSRNGWRLRTFLANGIIAQNSDMMRSFFMDQKKVTMIPSGVNLEDFAPVKPDPQMRGRFGSSNHSRVLITVANFVPVKGIEILIRAFARAADRSMDWVLWLVGDYSNEYGQRLVELVRSLALGERIVFLGQQENVRRCLDHAEIFVIPTLDEGRREGSPVALLEAMANGKLVLASAVPGVTDQLEQFPDHLFRAGDVDELAGKLEHWMRTDQRKIRQRGMELRDHVSEYYSIDLVGSRHAGFYRAVLRRAE